MARRKEARILGPYEEARGWRVRFINREGKKQNILCPTLEAAQALIWELEREVLGKYTLEDCIDLWELDLKKKGLKPKTIAGEIKRARLLLPLKGSIASYSAEEAERKYLELVDRGLAADTHRWYRSTCIRFFDFAVAMGWLGENPWAKVRPLGKRRRGKMQLRVDEARQWADEAFRRLDVARQANLARLPKAERRRIEGQAEGALAGLIALLLGMRAGEIVQLKARDVDASGTLLWIESGKTEAAKRHMKVPHELRAPLLERASGRRWDQYLFGGGDAPRATNWPNRCVQALTAAVGVPTVCAHSMRGLHTTLSKAEGATADMVMVQIGHNDRTTQDRHYADQEVVAEAKRKRVFELIVGGAR